MGKIYSYTQALKAKLADLFVIDTVDSNVHSTKSVSVQQIGETVNGEQTFSGLQTTDKTIVGAINEIGSLPDTSSGTIATFTTSLEKPLVECEVDQNATKLIQTSGNDNTLNEYIRGVFQGTHSFVDLGSLSWTYRSDYNIFSTPDITDYSKSNNATAISSCFSFGGFVNGASGVSDNNTFYFYSNANYPTTNILYVKDTDYTDAPTFTTAMSGKYLIYELATPTTPSITEAQFTTLCNSFGISGNFYDLPVSPLPTTYQGTNNFFTDYNASVDITYLESIKDYIDKRVTP